MTECDLNGVEWPLIAGGACTLAAGGFVTGAAIANGSLLGAIASPALLGCAAGATVGSIVFTSFARANLEAFCQCMSAHGGASCSGECGNLARVLEAMIADLGIALTACLKAAGVAWIPWGGLAPILAVAGALALQVPLEASAWFFLNQLKQCAAGRELNPERRRLVPMRRATHRISGQALSRNVSS